MWDATVELAAIVESSDDAIISKGIDGTIRSWNRAAERLYGYAADEAVGQPISLIIPSDLAGEDRDIIVRVQGGEKLEHFETRRVRKDGSVVPVSLTISPIRDAEGVITGASTIARDVSDREEADELRLHLAAIVDSAEDAILSKSLDGAILSWNRGARALYGYTAEEVIGKSIRVLVPPDRPGEVDSILDRIRRGERVEHFETVRMRKNGSIVPVSLTISPIRNARGEITGASTIARDTSERVAMLEALDAALAQAQSANVLKSEFLATMSHEIRTPMNGVIGMTGLLLDTELDREQREYAETVRSSGEALMSVINDILDFSKIEAGKLEIEMIDFDLRSAVEELVDLLAERAHAKGLELVTVIPAEVPTRLCGDPGRLRQVLTNLLGNAIKFTEQGEVAVRAEVIDGDGDEVLVRFEIADTGPGIDPGIQERLFESFSQGDSSTTRTHGGTGLGLAISRQLAELMGGEIGVESDPGAGSTFWFTAQLQKRPDQAQPTIREDLRDLTVLIVDDNETNRKILCHHVDSWGMRTQAVEDGPSALEQLRGAGARDEPYDVAILDMAMPGMDGVQLARAIGADPALAETRLILLTSSGVRRSVDDARQAGFDAYLSKPVRQSQLFDCLVTVMGSVPDAGEMVTIHVISEARARARPRLLVAEDNAVNQRLAVAMLAKMGYRADVAANGREAVEALDRIPYGAVLMDCQMPEMDGYEATAEIRSRKDGSSDIPIIAMTAGAMSGDRDKCLAVGMNDYVSKPVSIEELDATLKRWVAKPSEEQRRPPDAASTASEPIDQARLDELRDLQQAGEPDFLAALIEPFLEAGPGQIAAVRAAVAEGDADAVARLAHSLKGSSMSLGAGRVGAVCGELEALGRSLELTLAAEAADRLEAEFERARSAYRAELKKTAA